MTKRTKYAGTIALSATLLVLGTAAHASKYERVYGKDGRVYCRKSDGTVGAIGGAVVGGLLGNAIGSHGNKALPTLIGAARRAVA